MQIDSRKVTANDIRRYEKLMTGKAVLAHSNAQTMQGEEVIRDAGGKKQLYTKHHWIIDTPSQEGQSLDLEFERPTSLIALNIELTFNCRDSTKLLESFKT